MYHKAVLHPEANYMELFERFYVPGIRGVYGVKSRNSVEFQALLFDSEQFSVKEAQAWCEKHTMKVIEFVPAEKDTTEEWVEVKEPKAEIVEPDKPAKKVTKKAK